MSLRAEVGMEFARKCIRFLAETAENSVPNIVIPVHRFMVFIANKQITVRLPGSPQTLGIKLPGLMHSDVKGNLCHGNGME